MRQRPRGAVTGSTSGRHLRAGFAIGCLSLASSSACDSSAFSAAASRQALAVPECTALGSALIDHSCQHSMFGPFQTVSAEANPEFPASQPHVNAVHTRYTITLPAGTPGAHAGTIKYRPQRTGSWVVFTHPGMELAVLDAAGQTQSHSFMEQVASCVGLGIGRVYALTANETYRLHFDSSPTAEVKVIIERLEDFEQFYYADADGDGFGDPAMSVTTACIAPEGFVVDDTDCDDDSAVVHVGAEELCDDADNDCDGMTDEQLDCSIGIANVDAGGAVPDASAEANDASDTMNAAGSTGEAGTGGTSAPDTHAGAGGEAATAPPRAGSGGSAVERDAGAADADTEPTTRERGSETASADPKAEGAAKPADSSGCQAVVLGQTESSTWSWSACIFVLAAARRLRRRTQLSL